jgi:GNAT superfamily N-acetyltransferase
MKIIDLSEEHRKSYFLCLEDWSEELKDGGDHKEKWYDAMKDRGLRVKLAESDDGHIGGMIQYVPIGHSAAEGKDLYFIQCVWVHGYKQGLGNFQGKGMGKALLRAAEEDSRSLGARGIAAWGVSLPVFMRASWFRKQGYRVADRKGISVLLWKPFSADALPPKWVGKGRKPQTHPGKVTVTSFLNGWCPAQNLVHERAKRAAAEFADKVVFEEHHTMDRNVLLEWGQSDALYVDGKAVRTGPPPSYEKLRAIVEKRVRRLR